MDAHNLYTASDYINSLLLARGLLRNGKPIDFAEPPTGADGVEGTMTRIINLVHDLVVRRDRDAEQQENLASTIRALRNTEAKQTLEIEHLEARVDELSRSLALTEGQERAFKTNIRNAETTIRTLKDQVQRMKSTIHQMRAQYANDIRKRDTEMQKLRGRLSERTRGKRDAPSATTITIIPPQKPTLTRQKSSEGGEGLDTPGYSLRQETTEFLTQLCQSLSDENDALIQLAQDSIKTLKELQGLTELSVNAASQGPDILELETDTFAGPVPPYETLSAEMSYVLEQLRALLTNPSFVSLEEVEIRDNEISRLRESWEKMETKWREAVAMMDNWHKRMAGGGGGVDIDELKVGMTLGTRVDEGAEYQEPEVSVPDDAEHSDSASKEMVTESPTRQASTHAPIKRTVRFAARGQNVLGECSGNKQPPKSPQRSPVTETFEGKPTLREDVMCGAEKPDNGSPRRRRSVKEPAPKTRPVGHRFMTRQATGAKLTAVKPGTQEQLGKPRSKKRSSTSGDSNPRSRRRKSAFCSKELERLSKIVD